MKGLEANQIKIANTKNLIEACNNGDIEAVRLSLDASSGFNDINYGLIAACAQGHSHQAKAFFGLINIGRCGSQVLAPGHMLFYFATADSVWYIDCQKFDGEKQIVKGVIFTDLSQAYNFGGQNRLGPNTFGAIVYFIPIKSLPLQAELVTVKKEVFS